MNAMNAMKGMKGMNPMNAMKAMKGMKAMNYVAIAALVALVILVLVYYRVAQKISGQQWDPSHVRENFSKNPCIMYTSYNKSYVDKTFVRLNREILSRYARIHGYEYKVLIHEDNFMSPYWTRVFDLERLLYKSPDNSLIMYFDADAVPRAAVKNISIQAFVDSIDSYRRSRGEILSDFYVSEDPAVTLDFMYPGVFNSGVFIVRNTPGLRALVKRWMSMYNDGHKWHHKNNKWECEIYDRTCLWSFKGYEQYALTELYQESPELFTRLHWTVLASAKDRDNCFVTHLMGAHDEQREKYFEKSLALYNS
jgi:hypothetical protein